MSEAAVRIETKLDAPLVRKLESYCTYLDSDRDYVIGQALEIAFKKDQGFCEWLERQTPMELTGVPATGDPAMPVRKGRLPGRAANVDHGASGAGTGAA